MSLITLYMHTMLSANPLPWGSLFSNNGAVLETVWCSVVARSAVHVHSAVLSIWNVMFVLADWLWHSMKPSFSDTVFFPLSSLGYGSSKWKTCLWPDGGLHLSGNRHLPVLHPHPKGIWYGQHMLLLPTPHCLDTLAEIALTPRLQFPHMSIITIIPDCI